MNFLKMLWSWLFPPPPPIKYDYWRQDPVKVQSYIDDDDFPFSLEPRPLSQGPNREVEP